MIEINKDTVILSLETYLELLNQIEFLKFEILEERYTRKGVVK